MSPFTLQLIIHLDVITWDVASLGGVTALKFTTNAAVPLLLSVMLLTNHDCKCQWGWLNNDMCNLQGCGREGTKLFWKAHTKRLSPVKLFPCVDTSIWYRKLWKASIYHISLQRYPKCIILIPADSCWKDKI